MEHNGFNTKQQGTPMSHYRSVLKAESHLYNKPISTNFFILFLMFFMLYVFMLFCNMWCWWCMCGGVGGEGSEAGGGGGVFGGCSCLNFVL